jgi:hypothetical protein
MYFRLLRAGKMSCTSTPLRDAALRADTRLGSAINVGGHDAYLLVGFGDGAQEDPTEILEILIGAGANGAN